MGGSSLGRRASKNLLPDDRPVMSVVAGGKDDAHLRPIGRGANDRVFPAVTTCVSVNGRLRPR